MAERRLHGLQRVLGVNALFSTAYGNVGSPVTANAAGYASVLVALAARHHAASTTATAATLADRPCLVIVEPAATYA